MSKKGFGAVDMLLALVIIAAVFAFVMPALKGFDGGSLKDSAINYESAQEQIDNKINEIEQMRQQSINYNRQTETQEF